MKRTAFIGFAALVVLGACNKGTANNSAAASVNSTVTANAASTAAPAAAPAAAGTPVTQASLVGTWGQDNLRQHHDV